MRLSRHGFRSNEVRLWLSAYNPGNLWRRLQLRQRIGNRSLTSLQQPLLKTGYRLPNPVPASELRNSACETAGGV